VRNVHLAMGHLLPGLPIPIFHSSPLVLDAADLHEVVAGASLTLVEVVEDVAEDVNSRIVTVIFSGGRSHRHLRDGAVTFHEMDASPNAEMIDGSSGAKRNDVPNGTIVSAM